MKRYEISVKEEKSMPVKIQKKELQLSNRISVLFIQETVYFYCFVRKA